MSNWLPAFACGLVGFGLVGLLVPIILRSCARLECQRNEFHHGNRRAIPRFGGVALAVAFVGVELIIWVFFPEAQRRVPSRLTVIVSSLAMFALGFCDDLKPLGAKRKLAGQVLIAWAVYWCGLGIETFKLPFTGHIVELHGWGAVLTVLWLVGFTNLLNLIDGVDGLAGGIALMLMALLVYVGAQNGTFVLLTSGMTGALLAFLWFNFPPARIYLGDGGAYFLGFQIGTFAMVSSHKGTIFASLIAPLFVLALPIVDTSLAILRRGLRGLPLFRPDRRHIHHRLLGMGMTRRQVVLWLYGLTLVFLAMGFAAFWSHGQLIPVLAGIAVVILLLCAGRLSFSREWFAVGRMLGNSLAMRQEVHYAISLMNCLEYQAARCASLEELFSDLVSAARHLGFTSVKATLTNSERLWQAPAQANGVHSFRYELQGGYHGVLELKAPSTLGGSAADPGRSAARGPDMRSFEIKAELLAEGWDKAMGRSRFACEEMRFHNAPAVAELNGPLPANISPPGRAIRAKDPPPLRNEPATAAMIDAREIRNRRNLSAQQTM